MVRSRFRRRFISPAPLSVAMVRHCEGDFLKSDTEDDCASIGVEREHGGSQPTNKPRLSSRQGVARDHVESANGDSDTIRFACTQKSSNVILRSRRSRRRSMERRSSSGQRRNSRVRRSSSRRKSRERRSSGYTVRSWRHQSIAASWPENHGSSGKG